MDQFNDTSVNEDVSGMVASVRQIYALVEEERRHMASAGKEAKIILAGFSQGTLLSWGKLFGAC